MKLKEIIKGIEKSGLYDFIANNYYKLSKEDLKDLLMEYDFNTYIKLKKEDYKEIKKNMLISFEERNI